VTKHFLQPGSMPHRLGRGAVAGVSLAVLSAMAFAWLLRKFPDITHWLQGSTDVPESTLIQLTLGAIALFSFFVGFAVADSSYDRLQWRGTGQTG